MDNAMYGYLAVDKSAVLSSLPKQNQKLITYTNTNPYPNTNTVTVRVVHIVFVTFPFYLNLIDFNHIAGNINLLNIRA